MRTSSPRACRTRAATAPPVPPALPPCRLALTDAIRVFLVDLEVAGRAAWTRTKHAQELARLKRWLEAEQFDYCAVSTRDLAGYLRTRAHLGVSARGATICSLRRFYGWLVEQQEIAASPAAGLKAPSRGKHPPKALTRSQVRELVAWLAANGRRAARRDEALIILMLYAGLRAGEVARLVWQDYDAEAGIITIRLAKGNKGRVITIHPSAASALAAWHAIQGGGSEGPVFDWQGAPLTPSRVSKVARRVSKRSGVVFTAHILRHTFATWAYRESRDLYAVSKALGHSELKTTEIYVYADPESMRPALAKLPALDAW